LNLLPKFDIKSITDPLTVSHESVMDIVREIDSKWKSLGFPNREEGIGKEDLVIEEMTSLKSGVNSKIAFLSYPFDALAIEKNQPLYLAIQHLFVAATGGKETFSSRFASTLAFAKGLDFRRKVPEFKTSRLAAIADYRGKTRVVAIGDNYSQMALKPFAGDMMSILRNTRGDSTFSQSYKAASISKKIRKGVRC